VHFKINTLEFVCTLFILPTVALYQQEHRQFSLQKVMGAYSRASYIARKVLVVLVADFLGGSLGQDL